MTIILQCDTDGCDVTVNLRDKRIFNQDDVGKKLGWLVKAGQRHFCKGCADIYRGIVEAEKDGRFEEELQKKVFREEIEHGEVPTLEFADPMPMPLSVRIKELLRNVNGTGMAPMDISEKLGVDYGKMYQTLQYLGDHGIVENHERGRWRYVR